MGTIYIRENGEKMDIKEMNTTFLINALAKQYREIWNSETREQFDIYFNNIQVLRVELDIRFNEFNVKKFGGKIE